MLFSNLLSDALYEVLSPVILCIEVIIYRCCSFFECLCVRICYFHTSFFELLELLILAVYDSLSVLITELLSSFLEEVLNIFRILFP